MPKCDIKFRERQSKRDAPEHGRSKILQDFENYVSYDGAVHRRRQAIIPNC